MSNGEGWTTELISDPRTELVRLGTKVVRVALVSWVELKEALYGKPDGVAIHLLQGETEIDVYLEGEDAEAARRYFMAAEVDAP